MTRRAVGTADRRASWWWLSRLARPLALAGCLVALAASDSGSASAAPSSQPFYLVPSPTTECQGIKNCLGTRGPSGRCPGERRGDLPFRLPAADRVHRGGDGRACELQGDTGLVRRRHRWQARPVGEAGAAPVLLFHAASVDGRPGWFQPIIGCVSLIPKNKRLTTSAYAGVPPGPPGDFKAESIVPRVAADLGVQRKRLACPKNERAVSSWGAYGLFTPNPPDRSFDGAISIRTVLQGRRVLALFHFNRMFSVLAPRFWVQIGAVCEP